MLAMQKPVAYFLGGDSDVGNALVSNTRVKTQLTVYREKRTTIIPHLHQRW
jgi:hypothetical protein